MVGGKGPFYLSNREGRVIRGNEVRLANTVAGVIDSVYTGFTYDQDMTIAPDSSIHFVDTHIYFVKASSLSPYWYWCLPYTGIFDFHSEDNGVTWTASKVANLNGFEPDDEEGEIETTNVVGIAANTVRQAKFVVIK